jgi:hypothetical protein
MTLPTVAEFAKGKLHLDNLKDIVSGSETVTTPEGTVHKSIAQKISEFDAAINTAGYESIGVWTSGVTKYTSFGQVAYFNGIPFKPSPGVTLPYTVQGSDPTASPDSSYVTAWRDEQSYTCATVADMQAGVAVNGMSFSGLLKEGMVIHLTDPIRKGKFIARLAAGYVDEIVSDTLMGIYIPVTGTDYVGVRDYDMLMVRFFGASGDGDSTAAIKAAEIIATTYGKDLHGDEDVTYNISEEIVLGSLHPDGYPFTLDLHWATVNTTEAITAFLCLKGQVHNFYLDTDITDKYNESLCGIELGRYPDYPLQNYVGKIIKNIKTKNSFYNVIKSEIELDGTLIDNIIHFFASGDAAISLTNGNPVDESRSAGLRLLNLHLADLTKDSSYESGTPDVGLRLSSTEDAIVRGIINSYDITFDSSGTSGGNRNNRNLKLQLHRDAHKADAARNGALFVSSTEYVVGDYVFPTVSSDAVGYIYKCTTAGTTDSSEPAWDTDYESETTSGTAIFKNVAYIVNHRFGSDARVTINHAVNNNNNCAVLFESQAEIVVESMGLTCENGVLVKQNGGFASKLTTSGDSELRGEFDSSVGYFLNTGTKITGFLNYEDQKISSALSSEKSTPRRARHTDVSANYTTDLNDEVLIVAGLTSDITITVDVAASSDSGMLYGQNIKVYNTQSAYTVTIAATYNFLGFNTIKLTAAGQYADIFARKGFTCIAATNGTLA